MEVVNIMNNRTYICSKCGKIKRLTEEESEFPGSNTHCDQTMKPLSHIQAYAITNSRIDLKSRLDWFKKGGHILKGRSKSREKWVPAIKDIDIEVSKKQELNHKPKKPNNYVNQILTNYNEIVEPYVAQNMELMSFLSRLDALKYTNHILFISVKNFRESIYKHIREYDLDHQPKKYLEELIIFLISIVDVRDKEIKNELVALWKERGLSDRNFDYFPILELQSNIFKLRNYAVKSGVKII